MSERIENILEIKTTTPSAVPTSPQTRATTNFFKTNNQNQPSECTIQFRIISNSANGDCLFEALSEFLHKSSSTKRNTAHLKFTDAYNLRKACVNYVTTSDKANSPFSSPFTRWRKFRTDIKVNLESHIDFFKTYDPMSNLYSKAEACLVDKDPVEVEARQKYIEYMGMPGNYGTATEISAAMELYNFCVTLIKQNDKDHRFYEIFHLDGKNDPNNSQKTSSSTKAGKQSQNHGRHSRRAYMLFTGDPTMGHFELLDPISDCSSYLLPSKLFKVEKESIDGRARYLRLVLCEPTEKPEELAPNLDVDHHGQDQQSHRIFSNMMEYCKSILFSRKRPLSKDCHLDEDGDCDADIERQEHGSLSQSFVKRPRIAIDSDPNIAIRKANLNSKECVHLITYFAAQVAQLRDEFMTHLSSSKRNSNNIFKIVDGVTESRFLRSGNLNTAFIHFQPNARTEFCVSNYDVSYLFYQGASITLWTISVNSCGEAVEDAPKIESEPFHLLKGSQYALENHHKQVLLLRIFWCS